MEPKIQSIDVNPSIDRMTSTTDPTFIHTILPGAKIMMPEREQQLTGIDVMGVSGFGTEILKKAIAQGVATESLLRDMAGNMFALGIPICIVQSILRNMPDEHIYSYRALKKRSDKSDKAVLRELNRLMTF